MRAGIELIVRTGMYGETVHAFALQLPEDIMADLCEPLELSDNSFSLALKSLGRGNEESYATVRKRKLKMREAMADRICQVMKKELLEHFGDKDQTDGYSKEEMRRRYSRA